MKSNRFTVSLDAGVMPEREVIEYLNLQPACRRQQEIRAFVYAGRAAIVSGAPLYSQLDFSGLPRDKVRYDIYLQPNAGHDKLVLDSIKDTPRYQQPQWLKVALVMGHIAHTRRTSGQEVIPNSAAPAPVVDHSDLAATVGGHPRQHSAGEQAIDRCLALGSGGATESASETSSAHAFQPAVVAAGGQCAPQLTPDQSSAIAKPMMAGVLQNLFAGMTTDDS